MEIQVGDRVKIRNDLQVGSMYGNGRASDMFVSDMERYKGQILEVDTVTEKGTYYLAGNEWNWTSEMFEERYNSEWSYKPQDKEFEESDEMNDFMKSLKG